MHNLNSSNLKQRMAYLLTQPSIPTSSISNAQSAKTRTKSGQSRTSSSNQPVLISHKLLITSLPTWTSLLISVTVAIPKQKNMWRRSYRPSLRISNMDTTLSHLMHCIPWMRYWKIRRSSRLKGIKICLKPFWELSIMHLSKVLIRYLC
jgi:hypothetical protein